MAMHFAKIAQIWHNHAHWLWPLAGCCLLGWAAYSTYHHYFDLGRYQVSCSGGALVTRRSQVASTFARYAEANGLDVEMVDCAGSEEVLRLVDSGAIEVGFVSGGFRPESHPHVRQLATIGTEPLHLIVKSELVTHSPCDLGILKGRRVEVGLPGSGAHALATEILAFGGLKPKDAQGNGDYYPVRIGNNELMARARAIKAAGPERAQELIAELPDAAFLLNPLPSHVVKDLVSAAEYDLIPLPFCESFRLNGQQHLGDDYHRIDRRQVKPAVIPAFTYRAINSVPSGDCDTLGVPLIVVANANVPHAKIKRLIGALYEGPFAREMPPADLLASGAQYTLHPVVTPYLQRLKPIAMRDVVDVMQKVLSVLGAFSAGALAVVGYYRRRKAKSASVYVSEIGQLERLLLGHVAEAHAIDERERAQELEAQLGKLKQRIIDDYALGKFTGEAAFANLMSLISDTRLSIKQSNRLAGGSTPLRAISAQPSQKASSLPAAA
jgi:TRAP-type uncharacterized transport system substrate-binding protein